MTARSDRPNIIFILSDDMAWADMGCFGQQLIRTPNLDRMAAEGMRFCRAYSGSTVCAPSRSCLMQGLHQGHASVRDNMRKFDGGAWRPSLRPGDVTVARLLNDAGYATGLFGKWGLALDNQPGTPNEAGFDEFFGYLNQRKAHNYYPEYLWHNQQKVPLPANAGHVHSNETGYDNDGKIILDDAADPANARYSFDLYHAAAMDFLRGHADEPFFLYLAYTIPHGKHEVPELGSYKDKPWPTHAKAYAAMVSRLDAAVGDVWAALEELGQDENTLVFFVSDNGYSFSTSDAPSMLEKVFDHRGPYRGVKGHLRQGGLAVPGMARWPGRVPAGSTSNQPWAFWDFLPTAAEIAGVEPPACDGLSILPMLEGRAEHQPRHDYFYWEYRDEQAARFDGWWAYREAPTKPVELYDADADPAQQQDLAGARPEAARRAEEIFREAHVPTPQTPSPGESMDSWARRRKEAGLVLEDNVNR
jgi:arylsulfatase A-like enzyme